MFFTSLRPYATANWRVQRLVLSTNG